MLDQMEGDGMSMRFAEGGDRCGWPQAVLFDLDGTLIDSVPDLASAVNDLLATEARDALTVDEVRTMIGNGIRKLVERAFAARDVELEGGALDEMTDRMMAIYGRCLTVGTTLMPGAFELVTAYAKAGVKIGVVTNKPENFSRSIIEHFGLGPAVHVIVGGDTGPARKPAPDMLLHALEQIGVGAHRALLVGDSPADIDAAKAVPMASIAVRGGYTTVPVDELGADIVIDSLVLVPQAIERLKEPA
jgi:phosphoglycolate phosphatase